MSPFFYCSRTLCCQNYCILIVKGALNMNEHNENDKLRVLLLKPGIEYNIVRKSE